MIIVVVKDVQVKLKQSWSGIKQLEDFSFLEKGEK